MCKTDVSGLIFLDRYCLDTIKRHFRRRYACEANVLNSPLSANCQYGLVVIGSAQRHVT